MKNIFVVIVNALLFFFIASLINGIRVSGGTVLATTLVGIVFGILMASVPAILKALKISVTTGAKLLLSLVLSFLFYFLLHSGLGDVASITGSSIDLGIGTDPIVLAGSLETLVVGSIISALASVGMQRLSEG